MSLPDAETFYKMRIQTMDNAHSDTVGPFPIAKGKPAAGPPAIKVTAPGGPAQISTGIKYPIRWTSTCGTSANGPTDDGFIIDLMNAAGSTKIRNLLDSQTASYDGEGPEGIHNWHWDWEIFTNQEPVKYRIRVTNLSGHCVGMSEQFQLAYPQEIKEHVIIPVPQNCAYITAWCCAYEYHPGNLPNLNLIGPPGLARVGYFFFRWLKTDYSSEKFESIVLRSKLKMPSQTWFKDKGHLMSAKMVIQRQWQTNVWGTIRPCLGGVVMLMHDAACVENPNPNVLGLPSMPGTVIPINASKDNAWEVDLTQQYQNIVQHNKLDYGFMLYPALESSPCGTNACEEKNAECYKVTLIFRFAKDIKQ